jgi:hypothetical protein
MTKSRKRSSKRAAPDRLPAGLARKVSKVCTLDPREAIKGLTLSYPPRRWAKYSSIK